MSDLAIIREISTRVLDELSSAERVHQETIQDLDNDINDTRQRIVSLDDDIERTIISLRNRAETAYTQSARILSELRINRLQPDIYRLPAHINTQQALDLMRSLVSMGEETIVELEAKSQDLSLERKKWWKFW